MILEMLRNPKPDVAPTAEDKLRLVLVFYLSSPDNAHSDADECLAQPACAMNNDLDCSRLVFDESRPSRFLCRTVILPVHDCVGIHEKAAFACVQPSIGRRRLTTFVSHEPVSR